MVSLKQRAGLVLENASDEILLYDPRMHKAIRLNETAAAIWKLCDGTRTVKDLVNCFASEYPSTWSSIACDVQEATEALLGEGALVQADDVPIEYAAARAELAARHIAAVQRADGLFTYGYDFVRDCPLTEDNIVRQAGTAFALTDYLNRTRDRIFERVAKLALNALQTHSVAFNDGLVVSPTGKQEDGKTGATALAMLAELNYFEATGSTKFAETRGKWLKALRALQLPSGGFRRAPAAEDQSSYFNGETWLALAQFSRLFPGSEASGALVKADAYFIDHYGSALDVQFFHWGMLATAKRYESTGDPRFLYFLTNSARNFLDNLRPEVLPDVNTCYLVEGLAAGARVLASVKRDTHTDHLYRRILVRVRAELAKSLDMQIMSGENRIAVGEERVVERPSIGSFAGAFLSGRYKARTRIDFTQHSLSALLEYIAIPGDADKRRPDISPG